MVDASSSSRARSRRPGVLLAVATVIGLLLVGVSLPASAGTVLVVEISNASANPVHAMKAFDAPAFALGDFDGDGNVEIVAHNDNQYVYVLSTKSAKVLAEFRPKYPAGWNVRPINDVAVADVDGNGILDIIVVNSAAYTCRYEFDPAASSSSSFKFAEKWCMRANDFDADAAADGGPWVEDVDGDGKMEIFMNTEGRGLYAYKHDGTVLWKSGKYGGNAGPTVADLDGDGKKEALFFGDGGEVRALDAKTGSVKWEFFASKYVWPASIPVSGNAGDLDGDGRKEVVFIARDASHTDDLTKNHFMIFVLDHHGKLKWKDRPSWGKPMSYTHPVIHDIDGDGKKEIVALDWNTMGHKPGSWQALGPSNVFAYNHDGSLLWRTVLDNSWSNDDIAIADADGDGKLEVISIGRGGSTDGVWYLDAKTGAKKEHVSAGSWTALRGPVFGDFDGTGDLDWALPVNTAAKGGGFRVYDTSAPCKVAYGGWQLHDPCHPPKSGSKGKPGGGSGGGSTPPPISSFSASFDAKGGNKWWVQVGVTATKSLAGVDARANGGAWHALTLRSWGDWAGSFSVPDGSLVEFRARASSGESKLSGTYKWPSGEPTNAPPGGGSGGTSPFSASFEKVRGNIWWVETEVSSNRALAGLDARVNGGAWFTLSKTSWGSWAKGTSVPAGSSVEFRARATDGASVTSAKYAWPPN